VALHASGTLTLLSLGAAGGTEYISADALAALPPATRAAVRAAQRLQLFAATSAAIAAHAGSAFATLAKAATRLRPASLAAPLDALGTRVAVAYAPSGGGDAATGGLTRALLDARTREAETLEAAGRFDDAAALYRRNLADDARAPGARLLLSPPMEWSFLGLALKRAGRFDEAAAAYAAGVRAAAEGPITPDTPLWRESQRLNLCSLVVTLHITKRDTGAANAAMMELFRHEIAAARAGGAANDAYVEPLWDFDVPSGFRGVVVARPSGRGWELLAGVDATGPHAGVQVWRTREVSPAAVARRRRLAPLANVSMTTGGAEDAAIAAAVLKQRAGAAALPKLPAARCARCGVGGGAAAKRCGACMAVAYCGAECQRAHWAEHKAACKAARKATAA
jgi:hypothetical protein